WHPVIVAEQIGTLAAIAKGAFTVQCGLGWVDARFTAMGANIRTRPSAFEEALNIVRRLLAGEMVSSSGHFRIAEARLTLRPAEPVEVWIGASAPPAIDRAARLAEGWIASPDLTPDEARVQADIYIYIYIYIASAAPLAARAPEPSSCGATSTSASRRPRRRPYCSTRSTVDIAACQQT